MTFAWWDHRVPTDRLKAYSPATSITYTIPHGGPVRLAVFNLLGQEVALVFEGERAAGTYDVSCDKAHLPTGISFDRIQAPGFIETKEMTIIVRDPGVNRGFTLSV